MLCGGEFGRTPKINALGGRDHWPQGFTMALAGGGIRGGQVIGETDPEGGRKVSDPRQVADIHATVLTALGIDPEARGDGADRPADQVQRGDADRGVAQREKGDESNCRTNVVSTLFRVDDNWTYPLFPRRDSGNVAGSKRG